MTQDSKDALRKQFFAHRKELGDQERQRQSAVLNDHLLSWYRRLEPSQRPAGKVTMTIKFGTEPDTDPVMHAFHADGVEVWVPVSHGDRSMSWVHWTPDVEMAQSRYGPIQEPVGERFGPQKVADADVVFVPALAADTAGYRLGKGGGYYDRFLEKLPQLTDRMPWLITPLFDHELFEAADQAFPIEDHDLPVQAVVTAASGFHWV
ncbi:5-formyltetrahydrofolate cyclo-ligase [Enteractinococcus coprophilus]|nr:5-formyltetrahydrofolate cyclo-ligase [Enteractinococcus coprophilus]